MRSLLAAFTMASTSMSVMSPCWMMMRSVRGFIEGIVKQNGREQDALGSEWRYRITAIRGQISDISDQEADLLKIRLARRADQQKKRQRAISSAEPWDQ